VEEQRFLDSQYRPFYSHLRSLDDTVRRQAMDLLWAFVPVDTLDEALAMMQEAGRQKWPDFRLDRHIFLV